MAHREKLTLKPRPRPADNDDREIASLLAEVPASPFELAGFDRSNRDDTDATA